MGRGYAWSNVEGDLLIDGDALEQEVIEILATHVEIPGDMDFGLGVTFESTGSYDPGNYGARPEDAELETHEDEREITGMDIDGMALPKDAVAAIDPFVRGAVEDVDLKHEQREASYV